jgi:hypothetical protein
VRPLLDIEAPQSYFAGYNPANINSIVVLRDISDEVTSFCDHNTEMTMDRAKSQMRLLARAHAQGYSNSAVRNALQAIVTWPEFFMKTLDFGMEAGWTART